MIDYEMTSKFLITIKALFFKLIYYIINILYIFYLMQCLYLALECPFSQ